MLHTCPVTAVTIRALYDHMKWTAGLLLNLLFGTVVFASAVNHLPDGFVYLGDVMPAVVTDVRYHGSENFIGAPVDGYEAPVIIITARAAKALQAVQQELTGRGLGLKVFDFKDFIL